MASSDVKTKRLSATGSAGVGPARIRQLQVKTTTGTPRLTMTDGNGGSTVLDMDLDADDTHSVNIPEEGLPNVISAELRPELCRYLGNRFLQLGVSWREMRSKRSI